MADIVERLRGPAPLHWEAKEAADIITALRAENEKLRAALRDIATGQVTYLPFIQTVARAALGGKDG